LYFFGVRGAERADVSLHLQAESELAQMLGQVYMLKGLVNEMKETEVGEENRRQREKSEIEKKMEEDEERRDTERKMAEEEEKRKEEERKKEDKAARVKIEEEWGRVRKEREEFEQEREAKEKERTDVSEEKDREIWNLQTAMEKVRLLVCWLILGFFDVSSRRGWELLLMRSAPFSASRWRKRKTICEKS